MKITDKRSYIVFENVDDGAIFDCNGCIFIKLDIEVRDVIDMGAIYNAVDLKTVKTIKYTQNSELVKDGNQWFRCKNRD